jgi:hypothetical protein
MTPGKHERLRVVERDQVIDGAADGVGFEAHDLV